MAFENKYDYATRDHDHDIYTRLICSPEIISGDKINIFDVDLSTNNTFTTSKFYVPNADLEPYKEKIV
jgi:hypothetical protein